MGTRQPWGRRFCARLWRFGWDGVSRGERGVWLPWSSARHQAWIRRLGAPGVSRRFSPLTLPAPGDVSAIPSLSVRDSPETRRSRELLVRGRPGGERTRATRAGPPPLTSVLSPGTGLTLPQASCLGLPAETWALTRARSRPMPAPLRAPGAGQGRSLAEALGGGVRAPARTRRCHPGVPSFPGS